MSDKRSPLVSRAGFGKQGYCKLCAFAEENALNERIKAGWNARQVADWLRDKYGVTATRATIYRHRDDHIKHPQDRLVTAVEKSQAKAVATKPVTSTEQFLEAVRDTAMQRAISNPDEVTIDHGLKAAQILASQKRGGGDTLIILAKVMTGASQPYEVIEGTATEVPA